MIETALPARDPQCAVGVSRRALLVAPLACAGALAAAPATRWPALELRDADGTPLPAVAADGRVTHVDFWASWCAPCRLSFPWMNQMHERWSAAGLRIVAINLDRRDADARRFLSRYPARFEVAFDAAAETAQRLDIQAMPTALLVSRDGVVLHTHRGFRLEDVPALEQRIRDALG